MKIFSADGGGYLGLATATFIDHTERHFGVRFANSFDLFCGTSTGAIIALALSSGMSGSEIVGLYESFGTQVFKNPRKLTRYGRMLKAPVLPMYPRDSLDTVLDQAFGEVTLGEVLEQGKKVLVTAFSVSKGRPRIFKTDHSPDLSSDNNRKLSDVAKASSAAPFYFAPVRLVCPVSGDLELFCDGGLFANHPALLGYSEAVSHLGILPSAVRLLSVSTPRTDIARSQTVIPKWRQGLLKRGAFFWGTDIFSMMIDGTSEITHQSLNRLIDWREPGRYQRITFEAPPGCSLDTANESSTAQLKSRGSDRAQDGLVRSRIQQFFA